MSDETKSSRVHIPAETFIQVMWESSSYEEVAEKLGITRGSVMTRTSQYRKRGIELPAFARNQAKWSALAAFSKQFAATPASESE